GADHSRGDRQGGSDTTVAQWVEEHRASPSFDGGHVLSGLKVRGRTQRTPSMEMPPGKLERAKPLASNQGVDFNTSHRPSVGDRSTEGFADQRAKASRADFPDQAARPRKPEI